MLSNKQLEAWNKKICIRCKQPIEDDYQGFINMGRFTHDKICPVQFRIDSCPHCGKDID